MDVIDGDWIKARLTGRRGEQSRLAEYIGITKDQMTKTLSGTRRVQPHEIPKVIAFFAPATTTEEPTLEDLLQALPDEKKAEAREFLLFLLSRSKTP